MLDKCWDQRNCGFQDSSDLFSRLFLFLPSILHVGLTITSCREHARRSIKRAVSRQIRCVCPQKPRPSSFFSFLPLPSPYHSSHWTANICYVDLKRHHTLDHDGWIRSADGVWIQTWRDDVYREGQRKCWMIGTRPLICGLCTTNLFLSHSFLPLYLRVHDTQPAQTNTRECPRRSKHWHF